MRYAKTALSALLFGGCGATHAAETITYKYDAQGRLTEVARSDTVNNGVTTTYEFDKGDNRISVSTSGATSSGTSSSAVAILAGANTSVTAQSGGAYLVEKTGGGTGWNSGVASAEGLAGEFVLQLTHDPASSSNVAAGVSRSPSTDASYQSIDYSVVVQPNGLFSVHALGETLAWPLTANGSLWIVRDAAGTVTARTGPTLAQATIVHTLPGAQTGTFYADSSFHAEGAKAQLKFGSPAAFDGP
jgi:hypothetical protein